MLFAIDIGNSHITLGVYEGTLLRFVARLLTETQKTEDQYAIEFNDLMNLYGVSKYEIQGAIISSVVPELTFTIEEAIRKSVGIKPLIVGPGIRSGLNIRIDNPAQLGADLVAGAVSAIAQYTLPCLIFDLGTATTISAIDRQGNFLGGSICAGVGIMLESLFSRTALLPHVSIEQPERIIGTNTVHSMQSGLVFGTASMLDGMADRLEKELGEPATLIATGGFAKVITTACKRKFILSEHLLLDGLRLLYERNCKG